MPVKMEALPHPRENLEVVMGSCGLEKASGGGRSLPGGVQWLDLLDGERVIAVTVSNAAWVERVLDCPELEYQGPALEDIVLHAEMLGRTGAFEWQVSIQYKYQDGPWSVITAPGDTVMSGMNTDGYVPSPPFNDRSRLGRRRIRLVLEYRANQTGGGAVGDSAMLRLGLACRPFCC